MPLNTVVLLIIFFIWYPFCKQKVRDATFYCADYILGLGFNVICSQLNDWQHFFKSPIDVIIHYVNRLCRILDCNTTKTITDNSCSTVIIIPITTLYRQQILIQFEVSVRLWSRTWRTDREMKSTYTLFNGGTCDVAVIII